jgi:hypothetical protein
VPVILISNVTAAEINVPLRVFLGPFALFLFFFILVHGVIIPFGVLAGFS